VLFRSSPVYRDAPALAATGERVKQKEEDPVKAMITEDRFYRLWDQWLVDGKIHHIFCLDLATGQIRDLTPGLRAWIDPQGPAGQYRISPDGREIAFAASRSRPPHDPLLWGVYTVDVPPAGGRFRAGKIRHLTAEYPADGGRPVYSPDGRWIIFGMNREFDFYADRQRLAAFDRRTGKHAVLTENWDRSAEAWEFTPGGQLVIAAADEGKHSLYTLDFKKAWGRPGRSLPKRILRHGSATAPKLAGGRIFMTASTLREPPEVACLERGSDRLRRISAFTRAGMKGIRLGRVEEMHFAGAGGEKVQMFLLHPPQAPRAGGAKHPPRPKPLVHLIHGGPHGAFSDEWHWRWNAQCFAAPGYLVALVNFHGSLGWGQQFAASILGRWGDQPYDDIMAATDLLIEKGLADPARMAATGGSYGGYLSAWIASQTDRFAAIVNHAGVSDLQTQYASDVTQGRARSMGGEPWKNISGMDRYNPMRWASGFRSPMLVVTGERDYRVPHIQGFEIYNVYKAMRRPARLLHFPDENHWVLKPRNSRLWYGEVLGWLKRWL
jgi:dipeptidyl aminopeptidase/acylaminoacyl peptidase